MRANVPAHELIVPENLAEALYLLKKDPANHRPFAGGTDLMVVFETGRLPPHKMVSLWGIEELKGITDDVKTVTLGALATYSEIRQSKTMQREFPMLCQAAKETGAIAIQNRGTIGGNIANASPAADSPPALLVYDTELELLSAEGARWIPYGEFHLGYKKTALKPGELISRVQLKKIEKGGGEITQYYRKVGTRKAQAISKVCMAAMARSGGNTIFEARIAFGSVAATAVRCHKIEAALKGRKIDSVLMKLACDMLDKEIAPIDDIRSSKKYRMRVAKNLLEDFLCGIGLVNLKS